ncbi:sialate O-acetylesterase [Rhodoferax sp.]|uniref:sialate O-acetylesterase n=1 Tax=Rhodoferax sp. TaxID=50421 RepID=UPI001ED61F98|nr:sialate O-acetylesterase [Rhodoferax sp.]MBT9505830.1 hypothetical protein [Rhodoferax sp.]
MNRKASLILLCLLLLAPAYWLILKLIPEPYKALHAKLDQVVKIRNERAIPCSQVLKQRPQVILALGQSNAANSGEKVPVVAAPVSLFAEGKCLMAADPLPGGTGQGGSIWSRLPHQLSILKPQQNLVLSVLSVDGTSIEDWTGDNSPLRKRLEHHLTTMTAMGLTPQLILWQQGEAEARTGTTEAAYGAGLDQLAAILELTGIHAPIVVAQSTVCRSAPNAQIRAAISAKVANSARFKQGPDTDTLIGQDLRHDGCHFSEAGLDKAAQHWAQTILKLASAP